MSPRRIEIATPDAHFRRQPTAGGDDAHDFTLLSDRFCNGLQHFDCTRGRPDGYIVPGKGPTAVADREAIAAAIAMLPKRPVRIAVMDVSQNRPDVRDHLLTLDGFTVKGNGVIYLVQQGRILEGARRGSTLCRAMLAGVIWHEMAHLDGADERSAELAEEELWKQFVRDGVVDQVTALRYMQALRKRPDESRLSTR